MRAAKVDVNQPKIVKALERAGAVVLSIHIVKKAFDVLVGFRGQLFIVEIKNPEYLPKTYNRERLEKSLTDGEVECMNKFKKVGVPYYIVATIDEALNVIYKKDQTILTQN